MKSLLILFVLLTCGAPCIYGLSCVPCGLRNCTEPNCEGSGKALDSCGCCNVCAKQVGEQCRGIWNELGTCDKNLTCGFTREQIEKESMFPEGMCSDAHCKAIVDIVIALDGSDSITEPNFDILNKWIFVVIRTLYERFGACAHIGLLEYAGSSSENFVSPFGLGECTNNEDCYGERLKTLTRLDMGAFTYQALFAIAKDHLATSNRTEKSEKIIFVVTDEMPLLTGTEVEEWQNISSTSKIHTYALGVGIPSVPGIPAPIFDLNGVLSGNGSSWNVQFPPGNQTLLDVVDAIWDETVKVPVTCKYPEEYSPCKSTSCAPTCDDPWALCPLECDERECVCSEGYVRLSKENTTCVLYVDCPQNQCIYPEVYRDCSKVCNATCDDPDPICIEVCGPAKCRCADGYVWRSDEDMTCIHRNSCPSCPSNEVFQTCSKPCNVTCNDPDPICATVCAAPKCECKTGYVRRSLEDRTCIPVEKCSGCSSNEVFRNCSSPCTATCDNPVPICPAVCASPKCECEHGYVRSSLEDRTCIPVEKCPVPECDQMRCFAYACDVKKCPAFPDAECRARCNRCIADFFDIWGNNVTDQCYDVQCEFPEVYRQCSSPCTATCNNPYPVCIERCDPPKCVCEEGYVRRSLEDMTCIRMEECQDRKCARQCPQIDMTSAGACSNRRSAEAWLCHLSNWKCTTYEWKLTMEQW